MGALADLAAWVEGTWPSSTPVMVFLPDAVSRSLDRINTGLDVTVSYAVKANPAPEMLAAVHGRVGEYNATNLAHVQLLLDHNVPPGAIAIANPVISEANVRRLVDLGIHRFVVDDERGVATLRPYLMDLDLTVRILPGAYGQSKRSLVRFGAAPAEAVRLVDHVADSGGRVGAVSFFVGTSLTGRDVTDPWRQATREAAPVLDRADARSGVPVGLNIGGGFPGGGRSFHRTHPSFFSTLGATLVEETGVGRPVIVEPGRYLAEPGMVLATRVLADRRLGSTRFVHVDASAYGGLFETSFIDDDGGASLHVWTSRTGPTAPAALVSGLMDSFDVIRRDSALPDLQAGDKLLFPHVGAYSTGYTTASEGTCPPVIVTPPEALAAQVADQLMVGSDQ